MIAPAGPVARPDRRLRRTVEMIAPDLSPLRPAPGRAGRGRWVLTAVLTAALGAVLGAVQAWRAGAGAAGSGTLALARDVAASGCLCQPPPAAPVSPLAAGLLTAALLVVSAPVAVVVLHALLTGLTAALAGATAARCGWSPCAGVLAAALLATAPVLGAAPAPETALVIALIAALVLATVAGRPVWVGAVGLLLVLARPDLVVLVVLAALALRRLLPLVPAAVLALTPWWWAAFPGAPTIVGTAAGGSARGWWASTVPALAHWPAATLLTGAALLAGTITAAGWALAERAGHPVVAVLGAGGLAHLALVVVLGAVPTAANLAPAAGCALVLLALAVARSPRDAAVVVAIGLVLAGLAWAVLHDPAAAPFLELPPGPRPPPG